MPKNLAVTCFLVLIIAGGVELFAQQAPADSEPSWNRPLFLDIPEGSNGPCGPKAPCELMSFIEGQLGPAQMIRRPGSPWRLWWLSDQPMVRGTKVTAMSGMQGGGHMLRWSKAEEQVTALRREELPVLILDPSGPGHHLHSASGERLTSGPGVTLTASELRKRGASAGHDFRTTPRSIELQSDRARFRGPIAGGHTIVLAWQADAERRLLLEYRQVRASVLSDRDTLVQVDSWLHSTAGAQRFGGELAGLSVPLNLTPGTKTRAFASAREAAEPVPAAWAPAASDAPTESATTNTEEPQPAAHWQAVEYTAEGQPYTAVLLGHPDNPNNERLSWDGSALRSHFSAYLSATQQPRLSYRIWLINGHDIAQDIIQQHADAFAGRSLEPTAEQLEERKKREEEGVSMWG